MKTFDYEKAKNICEREDVFFAEGGLIEDWSWTGGTIYENGIFDATGILCDSSIWATPVIIYQTIDGAEHVEDCFIDDNVQEDPEKIAFGKSVVELRSKFLNDILSIRGRINET